MSEHQDFSKERFIVLMAVLAGAAFGVWRESFFAGLFCAIALGATWVVLLEMEC